MPINATPPATERPTIEPVPNPLESLAAEVEDALAVKVSEEEVKVIVSVWPGVDNTGGEEMEGSED